MSRFVYRRLPVVPKKTPNKLTQINQSEIRIPRGLCQLCFSEPCTHNFCNSAFAFSKIYIYWFLNYFLPLRPYISGCCENDETELRLKSSFRQKIHHDSLLHQHSLQEKNTDAIKATLTLNYKDINTFDGWRIKTIFLPYGWLSGVTRASGTSAVCTVKVPPPRRSWWPVGLWLNQEFPTGHFCCFGVSLMQFNHMGVVY